MKDKIEEALREAYGYGAMGRHMDFVGVAKSLVASDPVCLTCGGSGAIGGFVYPDGGYEDEPCQDCRPVVAVDGFDVWWRANVQSGTVISDPEWWLPRIRRQFAAHPQPVTPAGGEVEPVAWRVTSDDSTITCYAEATAQAQVFELRRGGYPATITPLYTHPPVADAVPPKLGLSADELLHIASDLPAKWRRWADGLCGIQAANRIRDCADDLDSALNQRVGGV